MKSIYGYFENTGDTKPTYDPGLEVACPICQHLLGVWAVDNKDLRTISLMLDQDSRSYFYRVHIHCHDSLSQEQQALLDRDLIEARARLQDVN